MKSSILIRFNIVMLLLFPLLLQAKQMSYKAVGSHIRQQISCYGYTGQEKESELKNKKEVYNYRARIYAPTLKRFLSADPLTEQFGAYTYVSDNPISYIDLTGKGEVLPNGTIQLKTSEYGGSIDLANKIAAILSITNDAAKRVRAKVPHQSNMVSGIINSKGQSFSNQGAMQWLIYGQPGKNNGLEGYVSAMYQTSIKLPIHLPYAQAVLAEQLQAATCDSYMNMLYSEMLEVFHNHISKNSPLFNGYALARVQDITQGHSLVMLKYNGNVPPGVNPADLDIYLDSWVDQPGAVRASDIRVFYPNKVVLDHWLPYDNTSIQNILEIKKQQLALLQKLVFDATPTNIGANFMFRMLAPVFDQTLTFTEKVTKMFGGVEAMMKKNFANIQDASKEGTKFRSLQSLIGKNQAMPMYQVVDDRSVSPSLQSEKTVHAKEKCSTSHFGSWEYWNAYQRIE